jgi:hypothetical protein
MKRGTFSGGILAAIVCAALSLAGCDLIAGWLNPLIGTWHTTIASFSATQDATLKADGTFSVVMTQATTTTTKSGTWTNDSAAKTVTFQITQPSSAAATQVWSYTISGDRNTLVLTLVSYTDPSAPPSPLTFTRTA